MVIKLISCFFSWCHPVCFWWWAICCKTHLWFDVLFPYCHHFIGSFPRFNFKSPFCLSFLALYIGLIIDAFSELRKKDDGVTEDLRNKCFICGLTKSDFGNPHQFDAHIGCHHSLRDYMYILLISVTVRLILYYFLGFSYFIWSPNLRLSLQDR